MLYQHINITANINLTQLHFVTLFEVTNTHFVKPRLHNFQAVTLAVHD